MAGDGLRIGVIRDKRCQVVRPDDIAGVGPVNVVKPIAELSFENGHDRGASILHDVVMNDDVTEIGPGQNEGTCHNSQ